MLFIQKFAGACIILLASVKGFARPKAPRIPFEMLLTFGNEARQILFSLLEKP